MDKEFTLGKMEENMMVNIAKIKNMDIVLIRGLMVENMKGFGFMASNMAKASIT